MNRVLAFTVRQIMAPCRVYSSDYPEGVPEVEKARARHKCPPTNPAHAAAVAAGHKRYTAEKPCSKCGGFERYTAGRQCVDCHRATSRESGRRNYVSRNGGTAAERRALRGLSAARREDARAQGEPTYERPWACAKCGGTAFYTTTAKCKRCVSRQGAARYSQRK